jgi:hypothetical protein
MAARAPRHAQWKEAGPGESPVDPFAVERRLRRERAKRRAWLEHQREQRLAGLRYLVLLGAVVFLALFMSFSIWEKIRTLFGL